MGVWTRHGFLGLAAIAAVGLAACPSAPRPTLSAGGCDLAHGGAVSPEVARSVLDFLVAEGFCAPGGRLVGLAQLEGALQLQIATRPEAQQDPAYLRLARTFAAQLSGKALDGRPVDVAICDENLKILSVAEGFRWGTHTALDACSLYVGEGVDQDQATRFLHIVAEDLGCQTDRAFRLSRGDDTIDLQVVTPEDALASDDALYQARLTAGRASAAVFDGAAITVHVADDVYVSKRSAPAVVLGPALRRGTCTTFRGDGVDLQTLARFVTYVEAAGFCASDPKVYRLSRDEAGWHVASVMDEDLPPGFAKVMRAAFGLVAAMFRGAVFQGEVTHIDLCDAVFESCESIVGPDLGLAFLHDRCSVFHDRDVPRAALGRLTTWLDQERFCTDAEQLLRLRRDGEGWALHLAVRGQLVGTPELQTLADRLTSQLSELVFEGATVSFVPTDERLIPARVLLPSDP